jgi:hypothetical protein
MRLFSRSGRLTSALAPGALCALAAHAVVYRSVLPQDGFHQYLTWYEPTVVALSIGAWAAVAVLLGLTLAGRRRPALAGVARRLLPRDATARPLTRAASDVGLAGLGLFLLQETIEHSVGSGRLASVPLTGGQWLVLLLTLGLTAALLAAARSACWRLVTIVLAALAPPPAERAPAPAPAPPARGRRARDRHVLALHLGLRAPPLAA